MDYFMAGLLTATASVGIGWWSTRQDMGRERIATTFKILFFVMASLTVMTFLGSGQGCSESDQDACLAYQEQVTNSSD